jgi:hypothetical protein
MNVIEFGIIMDTNDKHPAKHSDSMDVTEFGIVIDSNEEYPSKQCDSNLFIFE